ncbi:MAG: 5'/3'-nucleotidase SurE [Muribaculaceae bacterium]|nr:5'/3'-nucleotidase SurE [Muribaculaceae bacterium]
MKILVTNDDGFQARGIHHLAKWLSPFGKVIVVAPDGPRSAQSMAITVNVPLRLSPIPAPDSNSDSNIEWYSVNGTPVDCVKLAMNTIFRDEKPDMVVAGINHGSNSAVNVIYSGTMGAVMEGCICNIPSIGFSLTSHDPMADFAPCKPFVEILAAGVLKHGLPENVCLNVNIPDIDGVPEGMRVVRACRGRWTEEYKEYKDPQGKNFYMLTGSFINEEPEAEDTDEWCLSHRLVSVVPTTPERTAPRGEWPKWLDEMSFVI